MRRRDDAVVRLEAVHLDEQLIQRLLAFVVTAAKAGAAMTADRVDLVDEDNARRVLLALLEEVANTRRADADKHLDEVGTRNREEGNVRFARDRARQQGLAGSRGAHHQHALGNAAAELLELLRLLEELDDLLKLLLRLVNAGDVLEAALLRVGVSRFARDLPKLITFEPPPCTWFMRKIQKAISRRNGRNENNALVNN